MIFTVPSLIEQSSHCLYITCILWLCICTQLPPPTSQRQRSYMQRSPPTGQKACRMPQIKMKDIYYTFHSDQTVNYPPPRRLKLWFKSSFKTEAPGLQSVKSALAASQPLFLSLPPAFHLKSRNHKFCISFTPSKSQKRQMNTDCSCFTFVPG